MAYEFFNPNPYNKRVGDCSVRALCKALNQNWDTSFLEMAVMAMREYDMPSSNFIWGSVLLQKGFDIHSVPALCPNCITVKEFCEKHPNGTYVLACDYEHVVTAVDGSYFDTWDCGDSVVLYYYKKEEE